MAAADQSSAAVLKASDHSDPGQHEEEEEAGRHDEEEREVSEKQAPSAYVVYRAISDEGEEELERHAAGLAWSGLAAGLSMGFSLVAEGLLRHHLPESNWRPLVSKLGYTVGFLIVVLGRQQLFTENTLTPVLPLLRDRSRDRLVALLRLWAIVFVTNMIGTAAFALIVAKTGLFEADVKAEFLALGREAIKPDFGLLVLRGIFAGWLIALMVWLLPAAEQGRISVIIILTWLIGVAKLSHVIAGSVEAFYVAAAGETSWMNVLTGFVTPALIGNVVGGTSLVGALNYAQASAGKEESGGDKK